MNDTVISPLLTSQQVLFRFAAILFSDPRVGVWHVLRDPTTAAMVARAAATLRDTREARAEKLARGERPLTELDPSPIFARFPESPEALEKIYEDTFGLLVSCPAPPYEMEYVAAKETFQRSQSLADLSGFYLAFGLDTSRSMPERPDHITLELEFVASIIGLERAAEADPDSTVRSDRIEVCRGARRRFLSEHLAWWAPTFARLLEVESPGGFYTAAGAFLSALLPAERALLGVPPCEAFVSVSQEERPEACEGCGIGAAND